MRICVRRVWCGFKTLCSCLSVRIHRMFGSFWSLILLGWLDECCHVVWPCAWRDAGGLPHMAKRIVIAAWMLHGLCLRKYLVHENSFCLWGKVVLARMKGSSCVWQLRADHFEVCWFQSLVRRMCVVPCGWRVPGCKSEWNGCTKLAVVNFP